MATQHKPLNRAADDWEYLTHSTEDVLEWFSDKGFTPLPVSVSLAYDRDRRYSASSIDQARSATARFGGRLKEIAVKIESAEERAPKIELRLFDDHIGSLEVANANAVDAEGFCERLTRIQGRSIPRHRRIRGWIRRHKALGATGAVSIVSGLVVAWIKTRYGV